MTLGYSAAVRQGATAHGCGGMDEAMPEVPTPNPTFDERWFATALKSIGDAIIATDGRGRVLYLNPAAEALTGWPTAEARGKELAGVFSIINEQTRQPAEDPVARVLATGRVVGLANHTVLIARDRTEVPIDDSAAPILDERGHVAGVVLVFRDITARRQAELVREHLAAIVESSDDIIVSKTLDGVITTWNKGAERVLGYTADEAIGRSISMLMPPERAEDMTRILERIRRGERVEHYRTKRRRKDGTIIDVALTVSPIRDASGQIVGASKIGRDISEQTRIEAERREIERRKDELLAMLAHELRNPLASIGGAAELLDRLESAQELRWAKGVITRQVAHLSRLVDDLMDMSRLSRGAIKLQTELVSLAPIVSSALEMVRPLVEQRQHELTVSLGPGALQLEADPLRLEQILVNLLTNAAKYTEPGGRLALAAAQEADEIVIRVRDNGIGLSAELLPRIFEIFVQGDRTPARTEGGLGIGLTLVRRLAELHGGSAAAASEGPGLGSEFTVRLPALAGDADRPAEAPTPPPRIARRASRVLVVDDMRDTALALAKMLRLLGHEVQVAHDGPTAVELGAAYRPEVVLLDIGLPGMDGYAVARRLRQDAGSRDAVIIAVTGYGQEEDRRRSKEAGFDHYLVKPVEYGDLMALLTPPPDLSDRLEHPVPGG
jgi:PAS domain S-box-containing protein